MWRGKNMRARIILLLVLCGLVSRATAAVLPPEKLLPRDTLLVATVPDAQAAWKITKDSPYGRLWQDPALTPFREKFIDKFTSDVIDPLQRTLGVQLSAYSGLAQGQVTYAVIPVNVPDKPAIRFGKVLIIDSKGRSADLRTNLTDIRQKWAAAGKPMKSQTIRDTEFTTLIMTSDDLSWDKILSHAKNPNDGEAGKLAASRVELTFGQVDSMLLVSDAPAAIEKVLSRQEGGLVPALAEQPVFQADYAARLHDAPFYVWANAKDAMALLSKPASNPDDADAPSPFAPDSTLGAAGLTAITSASFSYRNLPEGLLAQLYVGVPESQRHGLLNAFVQETKDANPPAFVPADVTKFWRWRLDIPNSWKRLETALNDVNPQVANVINFVLQSAGKDKDEKYDLKTELLASLGDDIIHYEKAPAGDTLADLKSAPSIYLIGSPNPDKLALALKTGMSFLGTATDREFLGRQIYTLTTAAQNNMPPHSVSFAGSGGYVAISDNPDMIEEYLRSDENKAKALSETPGLAEAAQKVGGMATGLFGFDNQSLAMRNVIETLRQQPVTLQDILGSAKALPPGVNPADEAAKVREWADFTLLPAFDSISQYFYFSVYSGRFSQDGFTMNFFGPTPPKLR
jgi:hypothetical protein